MAYANKSRNSRKGLSLKASRASISGYRHATIMRNVVIGVIVSVVCLVIIAVVCSVLLKPERQITLKFEALTSNYYENVFYEEMLNADDYSGNPEEALKKLTEIGLSPLTLRDLALFSENNADAQYLLQYCDDEHTSVRFFPEEPFTRTSYRAEYSYSCNY